MQCNKANCGILALVVMLLLATISASCEETETVMDAQKKNTFLQNVQMARWNGDNVNRSITCFDVNEQEDIAIGMEDSNYRCYISVYDKTGRWLYGYSFVSHGTFYLEWESTKNISIYWDRSSVKGTFDEQANCVRITKYTFDSAMNKKYHYLSASEKWVKNSKYYLDANLGFLSPLALGYSRVLCSTSGGKERIVVDMTGTNILGAVYVVFVIIFIVTTMIVSIKRYAH